MADIGDVRKGAELGYKQKWGKYIWVACEQCGKERWVQLKRGLPMHSKCNSCCHKGEGNHLWHGGVAVTKEGYKLVYLSPTDFFRPMAGKNHYVREHRLVMAQHLGRCLHLWEIVHHINHQKNDNRIENLQLVTDDRHKQITILERRIQKLEEKVEEQGKLIRLLKLQFKEGVSYGR